MYMYRSFEMWSCVTNNEVEKLCDSQGVATDLDFAHAPHKGILYLAEGEEMPKANCTVVKCCVRGDNSYDFAFVGYFLNEENSKAYCEQNNLTNESFVVDCDLRLEHYTSPSFPMNVRLNRNDDGKLFTRIVMNPDVTGRKSRGKLFFPDRSWTTAGIGYAKVNVSLEKDTYGFLTGEMLNYTYTDVDKILEYCHEHFAPNQIISYVEDQFRGKFYVYTSDKIQKDSKEPKRYRFVFNEKDSSVWKVSIQEDEWETIEPNIKWDETVEDLCLSRAFTAEQVFGAEELKGSFATALRKRFKYSEFDPEQSSVNRALFAKWKPSTMKLSPVLEKAQSLHLINVLDLDNCGITIIQMDPNEVCGFAKLSWDEVNAFFTECEDLNTKADNAIYARLTKGKLRLRNNIGVRQAG